MTESNVGMSIDNTVIAEYTSIVRAAYGDSTYSFPQNSYRSLTTENSARNPYQRRDYEAFRPNEALPRTDEQILKAGNHAYYNVGIVYNVINLMSDLGSQGIKISHPNQSIERFAEAWYAWVKGNRVSNMFLNLLYRLGNAPIRRITTKINNTDKREIQIYNKEDVHRSTLDRTSIGKNEIACSYMFYNPLSLVVLAPEISALTGKYYYGLRISDSCQKYVNQVLNGKDSLEIEKELIKKLPPDIIQAFYNKQSVVAIPPDKFMIYHYKKDDWMTWGYPITFPIMSQLILLEKMQQADKSALDSIISSVRLWTMGHIGSGPNDTIFPTRAALKKLESILLTHAGGGAYDVVWGPELTFKESDSRAYQSLGKTKYEPVWNGIYEGLGIPATMTAAGSNSGFTNNYIAMKTLIERLDYGRNLLIEFWNHELRLLAEARGWSSPPKVEFIRATLEDENAKRQILLHMWDRNIISNDDILLELEKDPGMVEIRKRREERKRESGKIPAKASPFHDPEQKHALEKIFAQAGVITPSELGLELKPRKEGEVPQVEQQAATQMKIAEQRAVKTGVPGQGRPKNKKDSTKRKTKTVKPRVAANFNTVQAWAKAAYMELADIAGPIVLASLGKKNIRSLSAKEADDYEKLKYHTLMAFEPFTPINEETVINAIKNVNLDVVAQQLYNLSIDDFYVKVGRAPVMDECRNLQIAIYALMKTEDYDE